MIIERSAERLSHFLKNWQLQRGGQIGFVPTMGFLHNGHLELVQKSKSQCDLTVVSIFVNPTQFNNPSDLEKYPIDIASDLNKLEAVGVDVVFLPSVEEIYGNWDMRTYAIGTLEHVLEGKFRPGHFQGVCNVIHRLLHIVPARYLFMGQKDIQQCAVVARLLSLIQDIEVPKLVVVGTLREESGLAMSSRNARLSDREKKLSVSLYRSLRSVAEGMQAGLVLSEVIDTEISHLQEIGFKVEYLSVHPAFALDQELDKQYVGQKAIVIAAWVGEVRLIDNIVV